MTLPRIGRAILRNLRRVPISNLLLTALVGINLTLVCQGHDVAHHHLGPHVTFLVEAAHDMPAGSHDTAGSTAASSIAPDTLLGPAGMPGIDSAQIDMTSMYMPGIASYAAEPFQATTMSAQSGTIGPNMPSAITAPTWETFSLDSLSFMLLPSPLRRGPEDRPLEKTAAAPVKSQTGPAPEPPPPRPGSA